MALRYTGSGYLPGIPARDLSDEELTALPMTEQQLIASKLYERVGENKMVRRKSEDKNEG